MATAPLSVQYPPRITATPEAIDAIVEGLRSAAVSASFAPGDADTEPAADDDARILAWEGFVVERARAIAPQVAQLLEDAIMDRLPWTPQD